MGLNTTTILLLEPNILQSQKGCAVRSIVRGLNSKPILKLVEFDIVIFKINVSPPTNEWNFRFYLFFIGIAKFFTVILFEYLVAKKTEANGPEKVSECGKNVLSTF